MDIEHSEDKIKGTTWRSCFKNQLGVAACLAGGLFAGLVPATSRYVQDRGYTAIQLHLFNDVLILLVPLCIVAYQKTNLRLKDYKQALHLMFQGLGRFVNILCHIYAYQFVPPANAETVHNASAPVFCVIFSCTFLQEDPSCATIVGSLWCIAGVVLLGYGSFVNKGSSTDWDVGLGMGLAIFSAIFHGAMNVHAKGLAENTSRTMMMVYTYVISTVCAGIALCFTSVTWHLELFTAAMLSLSCVSTAFRVLFFYLALKLVEVNAISALYQVNVFPAYGLQWLMLGFVPTVLEGFGLGCVLIGTSCVAIWEASARWKANRHRTFMKELNFTLPKK
ncbi:solute carrier family 35 member G2-like [Branchiostoma floridae x Branchiostoma japonicum]